ncbi:MAG: thioredoxin family protein [Chromatiales bacterium]|nr:thioredoxin family protein [Chromatiales bacterium]MDX9768187.1 thioredoxin family protein [Ectothiorhodospiraceae bacterium]
MSRPADALLFVAPQCGHCPGVLAALAELVKAGKIGRLEVVNVVARPEAAAEHGVRSVPWTRIGDFVFEGVLGRGELEQWAKHAADGTGFDDYAAALIEERRLDRLIALVRAAPERLGDLLKLAGDLETPMGVRVGIGAVVESFAGGDALRAQIPLLATFAQSPLAPVRMDACYYLGLCRDDAARDLLKDRLNDPDPEVREIAAEGLE